MPNINSTNVDRIRAAAKIAADQLPEGRNAQFHHLSLGPGGVTAYFKTTEGKSSIEVPMDWGQLEELLK